MKIETTVREDHQAQLDVELETEILERYMHRAARKIAQESKIPGFRPGKAPYDVVRRLYGDSTVQQQAVEMIVDEIYPDVLKEAKIDPAGPGSLEKIVSIEPPKFQFLVPLAPEISLSDYHALRRDYSLPSVTDQEVDDVIADVRRRSATAEPVERPAQESDLVYIKVSSDFAEPVEGESPEFMKETPYQVVIGEDIDPEKAWPFANFSKELIGLSANEVKDLDYVYPDDSSYEKLRGRKVIFHIIVQSVKSLVQPDLNEEFAQNMGEFQDMDDMRKAVRGQLEENKRVEYDDNYISGLLDEIVENSEIKYSPQTLDEEIEHLLHHLEEDLGQQRMDLDMYLKARQMEKDAFIEAEVKPSAIKRLKRSLVIEELARLEKIQLNTEELQSTVTQRLVEMQDSPSFNKKKPTTAEMKELTNALTYDSANRLISQHTMERLRDIASGKMENIETLATEEASLSAAQSVEAAEVPSEVANENATNETETPAAADTESPEEA